MTATPSPQSFEQVYAMIPGDGWLSLPEAELLWNTANKTDGAILEVGCHRGRSTCLLAATGRPVYAVDPFDGSFHGVEQGDAAYQLFLDNVTSRGFSNVEAFRQKVEDWIPSRVGLCYLDGDHTYNGTVAQIKKALLCTPSVIAMHDVNDRGEGKEVMRAAIRFLGSWDIRVERLAVWTITDIIRAMEQR